MTLHFNIFDLYSLICHKHINQTKEREQKPMGFLLEVGLNMVETL
jgi:hypothetical protein